MKKPALITVRKIAVVIYCVLLLYWVLFFGALVFIGVMGGRFWVIQHLRELDGKSPTSSLDMIGFLAKQGAYLLLTVASGVVAAQTGRALGRDKT